METLVQSQDKLILEDKPLLGRTISYTLVITGLILILPNPYKSMADFYFYIGIVLVVVGGIMQKYLRANVRCTFDKGLGKLRISRIKPLQKSWEETYDLNHISKIRIESRKGRADQTRYRLALRMNQDNWVPLTQDFSQRDPQPLEALAEKIQAFL